MRVLQSVEFGECPFSTPVGRIGGGGGALRVLAPVDLEGAKIEATTL